MMKKKSLDTLTNEELWQLFPIMLEEHNPSWIEQYRDEEQVLIFSIGKENIERINHIGSTSVPGLLAKPTIDIVLEIKESMDIVTLIQCMETLGYIYSPQPDNPPPHMMFMKGYTAEGFKGQAFHVHVRFSGDWNELYFRDYLKQYPETAGEYATLKHHLKDRYEHDRDAYTQAKTDFITKVTQLARIAYKDRYKTKCHETKPI